MATFTHFTTTMMLPSAVEIPATDVTVTPVAGLTALDFGLSRSAGAGDLFDILIRYRLTGLGVIENQLSMTGSAASGDANVTGVEDKCVGGLFAGADPASPCAGTALTLIVVQDALGVVSPDGKAFAVHSFFDVFTEITVDGGLGGSSSLNGAIRTQFRAIPEPSTVLFLGSGLALLAARRAGGRLDRRGPKI
jgi:hypothetical protein